LRYPLRGLRFRLAAVYLVWFGALLAAGGILLVVIVERSYRADVDRTLAGTITAARELYLLDRPEFPSMAATTAHVMTELIYADRAMMAFGSDGRILAQTRRYPRAPVLDGLGARRIELPLTVETQSGLARVRSGELPEGVHLLVGISLAPIERQRHALQLVLFLGLPLLLLASAGVGVLAARPALSPVGEIAEAAKRTGQLMEAGEIDFPPLPGSTVQDEVGELTTEFNRLLARLGEALRRERSFLADAAHELRTPIAIVLSEADAALTAPRDPARDADALQLIASEAERMGSVVADLLLLARGQAGERGAAAERFFLDDAASRALVRVRRLPVAHGRAIRLEEFEAAPVSGNRQLVERALVGLLENALLHAAPSPIEVSAGVRLDGPGNGRAWVRVRDWGPGVAPEARERIFRRFARGDTPAPGSGLGLAIARWIAERHGGGVRHEAPGDGEGGAVFIFEMPAAD
jgi:signal transduction histidine kinase